MKPITVAAFFALSQAAVALAAPASALPITVPLAAPSSTEQAIGHSLVLSIDGNEAGFDLKVTSKSRGRGCPHNLIHLSPHGPDMSEVLPWHVSQKYFPNQRLIPVCGRALSLEVTLQSPELSPDGERFTSGTLAVALKPIGKAQ